MYRVLVVDDDRTCLTVASDCLKRWNYQVMAVTCALQALSILAEKGDNGEKTTYDLVLADVHMPLMDGFELLQHVHRDFNIPVVLISADNRTEVICKGFRIGAPAYLLKPVRVEDVRDIWQFSVLRKNKEKNASGRIIQRSICTSSSSSTDTEDKEREKNTHKTVWTSKLHTRFVEVILILGFKNAVPRNILEVMNVQSLTRQQVGSHLQKFRKFLQNILEGKTSLEESANKWIDYSYYSSIVGGNPNRILIQRLFEHRRTGNWAAPIPASLPLPPYNGAEASSRRNIAMSMPNNYAASSMNVATPTPGLSNVTFQNTLNVATLGHGGGTFQSAAGNLNMGNFVGRSSTYNNPIQNMNFAANEMDNFNQIAVVPQQNYCLTNGGLIEGDNNNMFPSTIPVVPSSGTTPILNDFIAEQPFNVGFEGNNILPGGNSFNADLQMGNLQPADLNIFDQSFNGDHFGYTLGINKFGNVSAMAMNEQAPQLGCDMRNTDDDEAM